MRSLKSQVYDSAVVFPRVRLGAVYDKLHQELHRAVLAVVGEVGFLVREASNR